MAKGIASLHLVEGEVMMVYRPCALDLLENLFKRYVVYPDQHALTAHVLWVAHTYLMELWDITPRLGFFSAEPGSGKSRALEVSKLSARRPFPSASLTGPVLFRQIDSGDYTTILIDQLEDTYTNAQARDANGTLTTVLSAGFESDAVAHRCEANTNKPQQFKIYAPVVMAGLARTKLPDSVKSRMIRVEMKRRMDDDAIAEFRKRYVKAEAIPIREALEEWCAEIAGKIDLDALTFPEAIRDRDKDIWEPLFAIAQVAGNDWPKRVADAARWFVGARVDDSADSMGLRLLRDCAEILATAKACDPNWLRGELYNMSDAPWSTWGKNGSGLTTFSLKQWLKDYGIKPYTVRAHGNPVKGYSLQQFQKELARFPQPPQEPEAQGDGYTGYTGYTGYNVDNKNNDVTDVTDVTEGRGIVIDLLNSNFEERAAFLEYSGGLSREEAEAQAAKELGLVRSAA